jgi:hypothetical protein
MGTFAQVHDLWHQRQLLIVIAAGRLMWLRRNLRSNRPAALFSR